MGEKVRLDFPYRDIYMQLTADINELGESQTANIVKRIKL